MTSYVPPVKNGASGWIGYIRLTPRTATGQFQNNPTLATGDVKVSIDGAALANLGTLPVVTPAASVWVKVVLSQAEINGDNILVEFKDAAGAEWCDDGFTLQTATRQIDDLAYPTVSGRSLDVSTGGEAGIDWANIGSPTTAQNLSATNIDVDQIVASVSGAVGSVTTFALDTGIAQTVWRSSTSTFTADTGSVAYAQGRVMAVRTDTGAAHLDQGRLGVIADSGVLAAVLDTGKVASAVWTSHATRTLTAFALDTGVADSVWKYTDTDARRVNVRAILDDTGAAAHLQQALASSDHILADVQKVDGDTGAATHLQQAAAANEHLLSDIERVDGDTGAGDVLGKFAESKLSSLGAVDTGTLAGTRAGTIDSNVTYVNETQVQGTGANGDEWRPV